MRTCTCVNTIDTIGGLAVCLARYPQYEFWHCTREPGHEGDHIVCYSIDHRMASWPPQAEPILIYDVELGGHPT